MFMESKWEQIGQNSINKYIVDIMFAMLETVMTWWNSFRI